MKLKVWVISCFYQLSGNEMYSLSVVLLLQKTCLHSLLMCLFSAPLPIPY